MRCQTCDPGVYISAQSPELLPQPLHGSSSQHRCVIRAQTNQTSPQTSFYLHLTSSVGIDSSTTIDVSFRLTGLFGCPVITCVNIVGLCVPGANSLSFRSHSCGELRPDHVGQRVVLCGWVQYLRCLSWKTHWIQLQRFSENIQILNPQFEKKNEKRSYFFLGQYFCFLPVWLIYIFSSC